MCCKCEEAVKESGLKINTAERQKEQLAMTLGDFLSHYTGQEKGSVGIGVIEFGAQEGLNSNVSVLIGAGNILPRMVREVGLEVIKKASALGPLLSILESASISFDDKSEAPEAAAEAVS